MKVWVTGASGFVGSNVVRALGERHGAEVLGPTRAEVDVTDGAAVMAAVRAFAPDAIVHWARPELPRQQDAGLGYLCASVVQTLRTGQRFTVWESPDINCIATPTLASDAAELVWRVVDGRHEGVLHCVGGESTDRVTLARRTAQAFGLDPELIDVGPPDPEAVGTMRVPYDTSLDATATAARLGVELPDLDTMLGRLRVELDTGELAARGADPGATRSASRGGDPGATRSAEVAR